MFNFIISFILILYANSSFANLAYITNEKDNTVSVIDIDKKKVVRTVEVGQRPRGIIMSKDGNVELTISNNIGTIEFSHPKGNSLPGVILRKLASTIDEAGKDSDIKVIVIKSSGEGAFCAGASFDELIAIEDFETGKKFFQSMYLKNLYLFANINLAQIIILFFYEIYLYDL